MRPRPRTPPLNLVSDDPMIVPAELASTVVPEEIRSGTAAPSAPPPASATSPSASPAREPSARAAPERDGGGSWAWFWASAAALFWTLGLGGFVVGFERDVGAFVYDPFRVAVFALLALAPVALIFAVAYAVREGRRLALESRRARRMADAMVGPAALAADGALRLVRDLQAEIASTTAAADKARRDLAALREALAAESARLADASDQALQTATGVGAALGRERDAMAGLSAGLEAQASAVTAAVERQTRMVAEASDLAGAQLREAEAVLVARTADLAAAAGEAQDATRLAAEELGRQTLKLEAAGTGVAEQVRAVEDGLSQQRAALVAAAITLRADQEDFSVQAETQRARLTEALAEAGAASGRLQETSARGAETLRALIEQASAEVRGFADLSGREQAEFEARARDALTRFGRLAAETRDALQDETERALASLTDAAEAARKASSEAADAAQARADRLGEAVFDAGRRAGAAFEARLEDARRLVEQSAVLVDEAGARAASRLQTDLGGLRETLAALEAGVAEIDERARRLPDAARERVDAVRTAVEQGLNLLADAARRAAAETAAVDLAFQERVKRNYDMLSEAVSLMGLIAGDRPQAAATPAAPFVASADVKPPRPAAAPVPGPEESPLVLDEDAIYSPPPSSKPASAGAGLRGRLKLTPTASDEEFRTVFGQASGKSRAPKAPAETEPAARDGGWTWKDLLGGMDESRPLSPGDAAERLIDEIQALGVDSAALLPRVRVEEAASALAAGDADGARQIVRRVAPAAVRRLSRRILGDRPLRAQADAFLAEFAAGLKAGDDPVGRLGGEAGRAWLLIDAAIGDAL